MSVLTDDSIKGTPHPDVAAALPRPVGTGRDKFAGMVPLAGITTQ